MAYKKVSWKEKLANTEKTAKEKGLPKVVRINRKWAKRWGTTGTCAIPVPRDVIEIMKRVPRGKLVTINKIREKVAKKYKATIGCPICCGIFAWIAAGAAEEDRKAGKKQVVPYWRTLKGSGELNPKYPGGEKNQKRLLEEEGHRIIKKGRKYFVESYQNCLVN